MNSKLQDYYQARLIFVNACLEDILPKKCEHTQILLNAMNYSIKAGGKRLRPILVIASAEMFGFNMERAALAACAMELVHTYSLIHDDLPAMDNDDFRRGMPTNHKKFGEANAILAGDALLTYAFELLAKNARMLRLNNKHFCELISCFAEAAGFDGMVGGQAADMEYSRANKGGVKQLKNKLEFIHKKKTAALIKASLKIGGILAGANKCRLDRLEKCGEAAGLVFQIMDDILDETKTAEELGKSNSDKQNNKLTYPLLYGRDVSMKMAVELVEKAKAELKIFGSKAEYIKMLVDYFVQRSK